MDEGSDDRRDDECQADENEPGSPAGICSCCCGVVHALSEGSVV